MVDGSALSFADDMDLRTFATPSRRPVVKPPRCRDAALIVPY